MKTQIPISNKKDVKDGVIAYKITDWIVSTGLVARLADELAAIHWPLD